MPKTKVKARELKSVDVKFISLVSRAANRIPFRIVKSSGDKGMGIDLSKLLTSKAAKEEDPTHVVAFGILKDDKTSEVLDTLLSHGFDVSQVSENEDGTLLVKQEDFDESDVSLVRMNEHMVVVVKGFMPYLTSGTFSESVKAQGFYSSVQTATEVFTSSLHQTQNKVSTPEGLHTQVEKLLGDFSSYILGLTRNLPPTAFYAASEANAIYASKGDEMSGKYQRPDEMSQETWDAMSEDEQKSHVSKSETSDPVVEATAVEADKPLTASEVTEIVTKSLESLKSEFAAVSELNGRLAEQISKMEERNTELSAQVLEAQQKADKVQETLATAVITNPPAGDVTPVVEAQKNDRYNLGGGYYDSASRRNVR